MDDLEGAQGVQGGEKETCEEMGRYRQKEGEMRRGEQGTQEGRYGGLDGRREKGEGHGCEKSC